MRALHRLTRGRGRTRGADGDLNPAPLAGFQWTALLHLKRLFAVGPNGISCLDLSARNITKEDFYSIRDWLAFVPVVDLKIDQVRMLRRARQGWCRQGWCAPPASGGKARVRRS